MNKTIRNIVLAAAAVGVGLTTTGCSIVSTPPDMVALHYDAGAFSSTTFKECIPVSTRKVDNPGNLFYTYPTNNRTYDASLTEGAETGPIRVLSKDNAEMDVPVAITFNMVTDCTALRKFHENMGLRDRAFWSGGDFNDDIDDKNRDKTPDGWIKVLNMYVGKSLDATLDRTAQQYNWRDLWNNAEVKVKLDQAVETDLQKMIDDRMGGHYFTVNTTLVLKPEPVDPQLKAAISREQSSVANANAVAEEAKAKEIAAKAEERAALADVAVAEAKARATKAEVDVIGSEAWLKKYGIDKGVNPWPAPVVAGGGVVQPAK